MRVYNQSAIRASWVYEADDRAVECDVCGSMVAFRADRAGATKSGQVKFRSAVVRASAELVEMLKEEKDENQVSKEQGLPRVD